MRRAPLLLTIVLLFTTHILFAQTVVKGNTKMKETNTLIIGASVAGLASAGCLKTMMY